MNVSCLKSSILLSLLCRSLRYSENHFKQVCCYMYIARIWNSQKLPMNNIVVVVVWMYWHLLHFSQFRSSIEGEQRIHPSFVNWICFCSVRAWDKTNTTLSVISLSCENQNTFKWHLYRSLLHRPTPVPQQIICIAPLLSLSKCSCGIVALNGNKGRPLRATIPQLYPRVNNKNRGQAW